MSVQKRAILYAFWASSCSWRVRAALHIKGISFDEKPVNIVKNTSQQTKEYRTINPSLKVPALLIDGVTIVESMAIIQYLEDTRPERSLMPKSPLLRAQAREICETIVSGIQPLQNIGLKPIFETEEQFLKFAKHWTKQGLNSLESLMGKCSGKFCVGNEISVADLCLVPQIYNAVTRYDTPGSLKIDGLEENPTQIWRKMVAENYPTVSEVYDNLLKEDVFIITHPKNIKSKIYQ